MDDGASPVTSQPTPPLNTTFVPINSHRCFELSRSSSLWIVSPYYNVHVGDGARTVACRGP